MNAIAFVFVVIFVLVYFSVPVNFSSQPSVMRLNKCNVVTFVNSSSLHRKCARLKAL